MRLPSLSQLPIALVLLALTSCGNGDHPGQIHASGHIEATEVRVAAKVGGSVLQAPLTEGAEVLRGDLAAQLDTVDAEHELAAARAETSATAAQLALLVEGTRAEDLLAAALREIDDLGERAEPLRALARYAVWRRE